MNIIYGAFCIVIGIVMSLNFFSHSKNKKLDLTSVPWLFMGAAYFGMFIVMAVTNTTTDINIYLFQVLTMIGLTWYVQALEFRFFFISIPLSAGLSAFVAGWTLLSYFAGMDKFTVLLPSTIAMTVIAFLIAVYYFIRSDEEVLLKNVIGGLFTAFGIIKIIYTIDTEVQEPIFYIGLFVLDYAIYLIISFLLFFNTHYKKINQKNRKFVTMKEIINGAPIGFITLDRSGKIIVANDYIDKRLLDEGISDGTIYDLFDIFPIVDRFYYQIEWKKIVVGLDMRQRYYKKREIHESQNREIQYDFHLIDIYSSNKPEIFLNISQRELEASALEITSKDDFVDTITGLPDKKKMAKIFDAEIEKNDSQKFAIILMSIANYRDMVRYVGTDLAEEFMTILNSYIKEVNQILTVGKISADTFELFTKNLEDEEIIEVVNDLIMNLQIPFKHKDYDIETKPLLGIALYPENGVTHGELFRGAQIALAKSDYTKTAQIQFCDLKYMDTGIDRLAVEDRLKMALEKNEFHMVFQPQFDADNEIFRGFEALLRWDNDKQESMSPNLFVPIAEELELMEDIGRWVLEYAIKKAAKWQEKFEQTFIMSVNVSSLQLEEKGFAAYVKALLEKYNYSPLLLEIEITEKRLIKSSEDIFKELRQIKELGVKIALDDFGTGYSSLDYLRWLPFDVLKIDKSFIDHINDDSMEREIVHSVISLVNKMNLETVAEGVENSEQLKSLQASSCTYIQGYLFSEPLNDEEVEGILAKYSNQRI